MENNPLAPELLDADNQPITLTENDTYIGEYKGWALVDHASGEIIDGKPLIRLRAYVADPIYPGKFYRACYEFTYHGEAAHEWNSRDAIAEAKAFIDAYKYEGDPQKQASTV